MTFQDLDYTDRGDLAWSEFSARLQTIFPSLEARPISKQRETAGHAWVGLAQGEDTLTGSWSTNSDVFFFGT